MSLLFLRAPKAPPPGLAHDINEPIRAELFSIERLEQHGETLAVAQRVTDEPQAGRPIAPQIRDNAKVLLEAYRSIAAAIRDERAITPAAEWLVDNFHVVEEQIREIRDDLPRGFYRQLPKLADGPLEGYPRVFGIAWAFVAHTDSHFDPQTLGRFVRAYQRVQPLTIGELWAVAITLRIVLVENLRRAADHESRSDRVDRQRADALADRLLGVGGREAETAEAALKALDRSPLSPAFAVQLVQRLRDQDPEGDAGAASGWISGWRRRAPPPMRSSAQEHQRQGAMNVTVRNVITSMRLMSAVDWAEFFESVSLVDACAARRQRLCRDGFCDARQLPACDRRTRARLGAHRARGRATARSRSAEARRARRAGAGEGATARREHDPGYYLISRRPSRA